MRNLILVLYLGSIILLFNRCELDVYPEDQISTESLSETSTGIEMVTNGNYAMLKDVVEYEGTVDDNNCYLRQYFQMSDFASDDIVCGQKTTDPLYYSFTYTHSPDQSNAGYFWYVSYKIISGANTAIGLIKDLGDLSDDNKQLLGENYFLRAFCMFNLVRFYAKPYALSDPNSDLGIIIRTSTSEDGDKARATIQETYNAIISDLEIAESYMVASRGNEYASQSAAQALLSRVYLYMDNEDKAIEYANKVINSSNYSLETVDTYPEYFANAASHNETIWLVSFTAEDNRGKYGSIASMIYSDGNSGWGEEYASKSYREALSANMNDIRWSYIDTLYNEDGTVATNNGIEVYYITKFSFQDDDPNLSSPVMFRLSEMYLNLAEAYAKKDDDANALLNVNKIRENRGLEDDLIEEVPSGKTALDVVLEEKRLEFAFEGHRLFDVFRNKRDMERVYWGYHITDLTESDIDLDTDPPSSIDNLVIDWSSDDKLYYIPTAEMNANDLCKQN